MTPVANNDMQSTQLPAPDCRAAKSQQTGCSGIINNMQEDVYLAKVKAGANS